jgi:hypothetical protein
MKTWGGHGVKITPFFTSALDRGFIFQPLYSGGSSPLYQLFKGLGGPQSWRREESRTPTGNRTLGCPVRIPSPYRLRYSGSSDFDDNPLKDPDIYLLFLELRTFASEDGKLRKAR